MIVVYTAADGFILRRKHQIKIDVKQIVVEELKQIAENPDLQHLIKKE